MARHSVRLGLAAVALASSFAAPAEAKKSDPVAKFKVVSASGKETLSFQENGESSTGDRCIGSTSWEMSWRSTESTTVYVFVKRVKGSLATILSSDRKGEKFEFVPLVGEATVSTSIDYQESGACREELRSCPEATAGAEPFLTGTSEASGSVNGGNDTVDLPGAAGGCARPPLLGNPGLELTPVVSAFAIPRSLLLNRKRKRLEDSASVTEQLTDTLDGSTQATASGVYTDELTITLKRLKLKR